LAVQLHAVKAVKGNARDHVALRPRILHGIKKRIGTSRDQMMESLNGIRHDGAERNYQAKSGMVTAAWGHDYYMPAFYHLRRLKTRGEIADQHRSGAWMKGDGHQPFRFAFGLVVRAAAAAALAFFARAARCAAVILAAAVFPPVLPPSFPPLEPCFRKNSRTSGGSFFLAIVSILHPVLELNHGLPFT